MKKYLLLIALLNSYIFASDIDGKEVFQTYCWGCHHETAMAFGPPFNEIASKRNKAEIEAYIASPESMYKVFGYKRTAMTQFNLKDDERDAIANYILSYKGK